MSEEQFNDEPIADGIYFNMPESQYFALDRLSATGIKKLLVSALQFWTETYDESFVRKNTLALHKGKAYHKRILEGSEAFYNSYVKKLDRNDFDDVLDTQDDLKGYCESRSLKVTGTKPVLIERIVDAAPEMKDKILSLMQQAFDKKHASQIQLTSEDFFEIEKAATILESSDLGMVFSGGHPEVSILWTDEMTGVKCKARFDYLRPDLVPDLKTFSNSKRKTISTCISQAIAYERYNIQAVHYMQGLNTIKKLIKSGKAVVDDNYSEFVDLVVSNEQEFVFVFQESGQVNNCAARKFVRKTSNVNNQYWFSTEDTLLDMRTKYKNFMESHGKDKAWYENQNIEYFDDHDFPLFMFEG